MSLSLHGAIAQQSRPTPARGARADMRGSVQAAGCISAAGRGGALGWAAQRPSAERGGGRGKRGWKGERERERLREGGEPCWATADNFCFSAQAKTTMSRLAPRCPRRLGWRRRPGQAAAQTSDGSESDSGHRAYGPPRFQEGASCSARLGSDSPRIALKSTAQEAEPSLRTSKGSIT
jgi:hypothetical protein